LFGEKYEDEVRVLSMGNQSFSVELCGGTHVSRTGDIGTFLITNQSSVASGVRRIEAVGGKVALKHLKETRRINEELQQKLNISAGDMLEKIESLILENKKLKKSGSVKTTETEITFSESYEINDWVLFIQQISIEDNKSLRGMVDARKKTIDKGSIILLNVQDNKIAVVCGVTENIIDQISAKDIVSNICEQINGRGGGRPDFAQGAGETENIKDFVTSIPNSVKSLANS
jgi:alanyl-tRNA synthetase